MTERWRRELRRLDEATPTEGLLDRARRGSTSSVPERRTAPPALAIVVAFAVFAASGVLVWPAFGPGSTRGEGEPPAGLAGVTYPSPPASGYYILLPDRAEPAPGEGFDVRVTALTNLPDGTLLDISTTDVGTCCPPVEDSKITFETQDSACYAFVGVVTSGTTFDATITAKPTFEPYVFPGPASEERQPEQPPDVLADLGQGFQNLSGDRVQEQPDGSKWLLASGVVDWPLPRCGGDPIPMFGGPTCDPVQQQLQGDDLPGAMVEVMGAISQGRMCEFWSVMLPPEVQAEHPWPTFAGEWRAWLLQQDFSDAEPSGDWSAGPLHWAPSGVSTQPLGPHFVDVIQDGDRIATLELRPLPGFCPSCGANVVPFWGVTSWQLYAPGDVPSPDASAGAFAACPDARGAVPVTDEDLRAAITTAERYLYGPGSFGATDPVGQENGLDPGSGTGSETLVKAGPALDDVLVPPACGDDVARATFALTYDDGTSSASLDFTLYVIQRQDGWKVWGVY